MPLLGADQEINESDSPPPQQSRVVRSVQIVRHTSVDPVEHDSCGGARVHITVSTYVCILPGLGLMK